MIKEQFKVTTIESEATSEYLGLGKNLEITGRFQTFFPKKCKIKEFRQNFWCIFFIIENNPKKCQIKVLEILRYFSHKVIHECFFLYLRPRKVQAAQILTVGVIFDEK